MLKIKKKSVGLTESSAQDLSLAVLTHWKMCKRGIGEETFRIARGDNFSDRDCLKMSAMMFETIAKFAADAAKEQLVAAENLPG